jgi:hypothetical protein
MRVRIVKPFAAYWNYAIQEFKEGDEFDGDLARHLADNGPGKSVEVLEADPEPEVEPDEDPEDEVEDNEDDDPGPEDPEPADAPFPADGTSADILAWVGDDLERAAVALEAEQAKDKPRSTLVKQLEKLAES